MTYGQRYLDVDKLSQRVDYMAKLLGDFHLPTALDEVKKSMEAITSCYGSFNKNLQLLQQEAVANISSTSSKSNVAQPHIEKGFNITQGP